METKKSVDLLFVALCFCAFSTLISLWSGLLYLSTPAIIISSAAISVLFAAKFPMELRTPKTAVVLGIVAAFLSAVPFLFMHPFIDASADPAAHISTLAIGDKIPATYEPYSKLKYTYQVGFPLFAKMVFDAFFFIDSGFLIWAIGIAMNFLFVILAFHAGKKLFGSELAGIYSAALCVAGKLLYQNMFWGQYTWMFGGALMLAAFICAIEKNPAVYIFFPATIAAHPGSALELSAIFFAYFAIVSADYQKLGKIIASGAIALPSYFISYSPIFEGMFASHASPGGEIITAGFMSSVAAIPPWIGTVPFIAAMMGLGYLAYEKKIDGKIIFLSMIFFGGISLNIAFSSMQSVMAGRVIELSAISGALIGGFAASEAIKSKKLNAAASIAGPIFGKPGQKQSMKTGRQHTQETEKYNKMLAAAGIAIILAAGLFFYASSSQLSNLRGGTKISKDEIAFAGEFKKFDPGLKTAFIIAKGRSKIAEASNKIPYDVKSDFYISYSRVVTGNDPYNAEIDRRNKEYQKIIADKCSGCLKNIQAEYIAIDVKYAGFDFEGTPDFTYGDFRVYKKN